MKSLRFFIFILGFLPVVLLAQRTTISGVVVDQEGQPLDGVTVTVGLSYTLTDEQGSYELRLAPGNELIVYFTSFGYLPDTAVIDLVEGQQKRIDKTLKLLNVVLPDVKVVDKRRRFDNQIRLDPKKLEDVVGPNSGVEGIIKTLPGVSSYSELSSQYNVRGGNFDENLVYVNGIEIYRPFLVRNGQQEGMSFINSSMVDDIRFSAGGFEARYGDKMSSVLDITYRQASGFGLRTEASFMGGGITYEDRLAKDKLSVMVGGRYRTNQLLFGTLDTEADFQPQFIDVQTYMTYYINERWELSFLGNYARNLYRVVPSVRNTDFGTFQEALRLTVFFDGQEDYDFTTRFGALSSTYKANERLQLKFTTSAFRSSEQEYFDVLGAYRLGELNTNLGSDDFGEIAFIRGTGGFQNYARNKLDAIVANISHTAFYDGEKANWRWGVTLQYEDILDRYKEWERIDSAGYSIPHKPSFTYDSLIVTEFDTNGVPRGGIVYTSDEPDTTLELFERFNSRTAINSMRLMAFVERSQLISAGEAGDFYLNVGLRSHYWSFNNQNVISPRAALSFKPNWKRDMVFRLSGGFYYQPPFYREMRDLDGGVNENIHAQRSIHLVLGHDYQLKIWNRPFKMVTEVYYKDYDQLIPYDLDNVRLRYRAVNNATGFATGIDYRINGEFVKGIDSWASVSIMTVQEDIIGDGAGFLARPTDQRFNAKIFFQDYLPNDPSFRVSMTLTYGTGLPFGPPQATAEERIFRLPSYRRVDIGFVKVFKQEGRQAKWSFLNKFKSTYVSLEVFNLIDIDNTVSYLWVKDVSTAREYAVPNFLTGRLLNLKWVAQF